MSICCAPLLVLFRQRDKLDQIEVCSTCCSQGIRLCKGSEVCNNINTKNWCPYPVKPVAGVLPHLRFFGNEIPITPTQTSYSDNCKACNMIYCFFPDPGSSLPVLNVTPIIIRYRALWAALSLLSSFQVSFPCVCDAGFFFFTFTYANEVL